MNKNRNQKTNARADNQESNKTWKRFIALVKESTNLVMAISTAIIAVFTIVLSVATVSLWTSGERHAERQLRAYVFLDTVDIINCGTKTSPRDNSEVSPMASLIIKNFGQTPAYDYEFWLGIELKEFPLVSDLPPKPISSYSTKDTIAPCGKHIAVVKMTRPRTTEEIDQLNAGTHAIYIYGEIIYYDAFGIKRYSKFLKFHNKFSEPMNSTLGYMKGNKAN